MYDALTGRFTFPCPARGEAHVTLSDFRQLERLPGASHPSVFHVLFACVCGEEHDGLVTHDDLDWGPLGLQSGAFYNVMTAQLDPVVTELSDVAARRIEAGEWPWSFFCYPEDRPRPVFPSSFFLLAPGDGSLKFGRHRTLRSPGGSVRLPGANCAGKRRRNSAYGWTAIACSRARTLRIGL